MNNSYLWLKSLHLLGVILFLGNIIIAGWWKAMADRTKNPVIISFALRQVSLTDWVFTFGGSILVIAGGMGNAILHDMDYLHTYWMSWGLWLFVASGIIWIAALVPIQIAQAKMAKQFADGGEIPARYWELGRLWNVLGTIATLLPLMNLYWMVFKPS
jgi:uncharacterized membrane protein